MIESIDNTLFNIVRIEKELFPVDYHDKILDEKSVTLKEYNAFVERNNELCKELEIQYLWSVIQINNNVHFTSATSPDKDVKNNKHASFFAIHSNPEAFDSVFKVMKPVISEFHNEWGDGRMILYPYFDKLGRKYCFGVSLSIEHINEKIKKGVFLAIFILISFLLIFFTITLFLAKSISKPLKSITNIANNIAYGKPIKFLSEKQNRWQEINSLNNSILSMHEQIQTKINALEVAKLKLEESEEKLKNQNIELDKKVEIRTKELNKLLEDKDRFLTILGHDLKGPFNSILGILALLKKNINTFSIKEVEMQIRTVEKAAKNTYNLLDGILLWTRAQTGKVPFILEHLNLAYLISCTIEYLETAITKKELKIQQTVETDLKVFADKNMLNTVLRNLISNAVKFTDIGGEIIITAFYDEKNTTITISDTGVGIDSDTLTKLFDNSEIITTNGTQQEQGTGLGLLICKEFIEMHGGKIWAESEPGKGSDFKFTLPVK